MKHGFKSLIISSTKSFLLWLSNLRLSPFPGSHPSAITWLTRISQPTCIYHLPPMHSKEHHGRGHPFTRQNGKVALMALEQSACLWRVSSYCTWSSVQLFISPYRSSPTQVTWVGSWKSSNVHLGFPASHHQRIMPCPSWVRRRLPNTRAQNLKACVFQI